MRSIARFCYEKRWFVVVGWIILLFGLFAISNALGGKYRTEFKLPGSESQPITRRHCPVLARGGMAVRMRSSKRTRPTASR